MAWTTTKVVEATVGGVRQQTWYLLADSATLELSTGLKNIVAHAEGFKSCAANVQIKLNILSAGTSQGGNVAVTGATSGNELYLTVWGN